MRILLFLISFLLIQASAKAQESLATDSLCNRIISYEREIQPILNVNCTNLFCHKSGSSRGDFTSLEGLLPFLEDGRFAKAIFEDRSMPKGKNKELSSIELEVLKCWYDQQGFKKKKAQLNESN